MLIRFLAALLLILACLFWLAEQRIRAVFALARRDNCFTWAVDEFSYDGGDGFLIHKSLSGWFPHVVIVKGARHAYRESLVLLENIPVQRVPKKLIPPWYFTGRIRRTRFVSI